MKNTFVIVLILFLTANFAFSQGTEIKIKFRTFKNNEVYLGFHYGKDKYIRDTAKVDNKGIVVFSDKLKEIPGGIYLLITPDLNYFEFILAESKVVLETDTGDFVKNMKVIESEENKIFFNYLKFIETKQKEKDIIAKEKAIYSSDEMKSAEYDLKLKAIDEEVKKNIDDLVKNNPGKFFPKLLKMMDEPEMRDKKPEETDSAYSVYIYNHFQFHYFDNVDFSDNKILRTPVYAPKIDRFLENYTMYHPDSIKVSAARIIDKSQANDEVFKFTLVRIFNRYANSEYMGMDAVFVYLAEKYYLSGLATWADSAQLAKIYDRVVKMSSNLIGMKAPELIMKDTNENYHSLHSQKAKYTILVFWEPNCGHCAKAIPHLQRIWETMPADSFKIYAVNIGNDGKEWQKFLIDNKITFLNVWDPFNYNNFRVLYDIFSSPVVYLLDENKKIVAKRIGVDKIQEVVDVLEERSKPANNK